MTLKSQTPDLTITHTAAAKDIRGWNIHVEDYPVSIAMESFLADVTTKTDGRIKGKIFHGGVLGSQPDAIEQIRL
jgi:TRAP-type C4-dicarboxylate transport system substrate-binding protein